MNKVAKFEKVSFEQFKNDWIDTFNLEDTPETVNEIKKIYDNIKLPKRATTGSAGYDFYTPCDIQLNSKEMMKVPTGIRVSIVEGWWLGCLPRSGLGFKFKLQLNNTMGVIDSDYYHSDNEGHIFIKVTNDGNKNMEVKSGNGFAQGIFLPFGITTDDDADGIRNGGFGSTGVN